MKPLWHKGFEHILTCLAFEALAALAGIVAFSFSPAEPP